MSPSDLIHNIFNKTGVLPEHEYRSVLFYVMQVLSSQSKLTELVNGLNKVGLTPEQQYTALYRFLPKRSWTVMYPKKVKESDCIGLLSEFNNVNKTEAKKDHSILLKQFKESELLDMLNTIFDKGGRVK